MKTDNIDLLLQRFYDGCSTHEEELALQHFFESDHVPPHLQVEKELFAYRKRWQTASEEVPHDLESRLSSLIDEWEQTEQKPTPQIRTHQYSLWHRSIAIAASLLILLGISTYVWQAQRTPVYQDTCATPQEAYVHTQRALLMFSMNLNKGMNPLYKTQETMAQASQIIHQSINY